MPPDDSIKVNAAPAFLKNLRALKKKYRNVRKDIEFAIRDLQCGNFIGNQIVGTGYEIFKVRVKNSNIRKGKSAGYRLVYQLESQDSVLLLALYSKSDRGNIRISDIQRIIAENINPDQ
jgi:mRNA-degrading endonuclease RelE of RelBE toxin-antitoxin system